MKTSSVSQPYSLLTSFGTQLRNCFRGIRAQLIAGIAIMTVAAIVLIGLLSIKMLEWNALFRKGKEAEIISIFIETLMKDRQSGDNLNRFVADMVESKTINNITIANSRGETVFITGQGIPLGKDEGRPIFIKGDLEVRMMGGGWFEGVGKELFVTAPLRYEQGTVSFSMPLSDIREESYNFKKFIFFYALFDSIIIIVVGIYFFSRSIIRPMNILKKTAENIAGGMLEQRVDIRAGGDIGSFASSFNAMTDRLADKVMTLERLNKELIAKQEELIRSEKLATVGRLAAGLAHEIGNPLGAMLGYVDILKKSGVGSQESEEILERFGKEIARIDKIVRGLLDFSRPSKVILHDIDVNKTVSDTVAMLLPQFSARNISFNMMLDKTIPRIQMGEGMLQQVLLNLFLNARDSITGRGTITVETDHALMPEQDMNIRIRRYDLSDADYSSIYSRRGGYNCVKISITDTGRGITDHDKDKIFDPFFSTKEQGKGSGLGLAVSLGIIKAYDGDIKVKSELGKGTTFDIFIPETGEIPWQKS